MQIIFSSLIQTLQRQPRDNHGKLSISLFGIAEIFSASESSMQNKVQTSLFYSPRVICAFANATLMLKLAVRARARAENDATRREFVYSASAQRCEMRRIFSLKISRLLDQLLSFVSTSGSRELNEILYCF